MHKIKSTQGLNLLGNIENTISSTQILHSSELIIHKYHFDSHLYTIRQNRIVIFESRIKYIFKYLPTQYFAYRNGLLNVTYTYKIPFIIIDPKFQIILNKKN